MKEAENRQLLLFSEEELNDGEKTLQSKYRDYDYQQNIILSSPAFEDEYTQFIADTYDYSVGETTDVVIPNKLHLERLNDWNVGVICGASGSGKSTILKHIAQKKGVDLADATFGDNKSLISNFAPLPPRDAAFLLTSMGLASVPTWTRPFKVLSNGEKYRALLAKKICDTPADQIIMVDEYTSVVDRNVAKAMSNALQKYIRKTKRQIIVATCHYDIFEWLCPDWVYDLNKGGALSQGDYLRQRPPIKLRMYRTTNDNWRMFKPHHYMTADINSAAACFCFVWDERLVAFVAVLPLPSGAFSDGYREHRTVVLPDYQGLGIGSAITDFMGGIYKASNRLYYTKTVNPALGEHRKKSAKWVATSHNGRGQTEKENAGNMMGGLSRLSYCFKYVGEPIRGYEEFLLPIEQIRQKERTKYDLYLDL